MLTSSIKMRDSACRTGSEQQQQQQQQHEEEEEEEEEEEKKLRYTATDRCLLRRRKRN